MNEVTQILHAIAQGDPGAASQLLPLVYDELRQLAAQKLAQETPGQTLQPTGLVHEAFLRLVGDQKFESQGHFFAAAAQIVQLHFFAGLSIEQAAEALGVSRATAYRQWSFARAWLRCAIGGEG